MIAMSSTIFVNSDRLFSETKRSAEVLSIERYKVENEFSKNVAAFWLVDCRAAFYFDFDWEFSLMASR